MTQSSKPVSLRKSKSGLFLLAFLVLLLFALLVSNIYVANQIRGVQKEYYIAVDQMVVERYKWGELMLEKMHMTSPAYVEFTAKNKLHMNSSQEHKQTIYIRDKDSTGE